MKRFARQHLVLAAIVGAGCAPLATVPPMPTEPPVVTGAFGALPASQSAMMIANAVAEAPDPASMRELVALMQTLSDEPLYEGNTVDLLVDGPATYDAMLDAVRGARRFVHLEMYIFGDDEVGRAFAAVLEQKAAEGVQVRLLYDDIGSVEATARFFDKLRAAGVQVIAFNPINPFDGGNPLKINNRDHRKILVVDGDTGFTGGLNVDENYSSRSKSGRARSSGSASGGSSSGGAEFHAGANGSFSDGGSSGSSSQQAGWRDTDVVVRGPAVTALEHTFRENWRRSGGDEPDDDVTPARRGDELVRILTSVGGDGAVSPIRLAYEAAIEKASARVWITQPYFAPDRRFLDALRDAVARGVDVRLVLPSKSDSQLVLNSARYHYTRLLKGGVRIFESNDTMLHAKTAVVDGIWSTVGSSNLDFRSFLHNDEVNAVVLGPEFGAQLERQFRLDQAASTEIALASWAKRGVTARAKELFSHLFAYWL